MVESGLFECGVGSLDGRMRLNGLASHPGAGDRKEYPLGIDAMTLYALNLGAYQRSFYCEILNRDITFS